MTRLSAPHQLSPHLFVVYAEHPHHDSANAYLVTGARPLLIDCGGPHAAPYVMRHLAALGMDLRDLDRVVATHGHCDHVQAFHGLASSNPDLRLLIHPLDLPLVTWGGEVDHPCALYGGRCQPIRQERCMAIGEGDRIAAGDSELRVLHTPGHTPGSICLLGEIDGHRVLFAGDTVEGSMPGFEGVEITTWVAAMRTWKASLARIAGLEIDWVLNGHEPVRGLPLTRERLNRGIASFGRMLNPWFILADEPEDEPLPGTPVPAG